MSKKKVAEPISRERQLIIDDYEKNYWKNMGKAALKDWRLYLMFLPLFLLFLFWRYFPMYDLTVAFKKYEVGVSVSELDFTGLYYFKELLVGSQAAKFWPAFRNTFMLSFYGLLFGFPVPILLALFFSEIKSNGVRSILQIASYLPKFVSLVVVTSIIHLVLKKGVVQDGIVINQPGVLARLLEAVGAVSYEKVWDQGLMYDPASFRSIYEISAIWSEAGYGSIVYFAAIIGISPTSYEAARIDGASKMAQIKYVVLPGILSTVVIMLIMKLGHLMTIGYEKVLLLRTTGSGGNEATSQIVSTFVFDVGGIGDGAGQGTAGKSIGSAADMLNAIISMLLVIGANTISKHAADTSLF